MTSQAEILIQCAYGDYTIVLTIYDGIEIQVALYKEESLEYVKSYAKKSLTQCILIVKKYIEFRFKEDIFYYKRDSDIMNTLDLRLMVSNQEVTKKYKKTIRYDKIHS
jgi:hypothetical protein